MASPTMLLFFIFSLLLTTALGRNADAEDCRLDQLTVRSPSRKIQSEGGYTELWDENTGDFQCAGVAAMRNTIKPHSLSLPNYNPYPILVYILHGRGLLGTVHPGCPETYQIRTEEPKGAKKIDQYQKVQRIKAGDVVLIRTGMTHFCFNDGNEDLVAVSVSDITNRANQLDRTQTRAFYLAGGIPKKQRKTGGSTSDEESFMSIFDQMDEEAAESFNISADLMRKMEQSNERGLIVNVPKGGMGSIRAHEDESIEGSHQSGGGFRSSDQYACNQKNIKQNIGGRSDPFIFSSNAGRIDAASHHTLQALHEADMSVSRLELLPNAMSSPQFIMNGHTVEYVTRGEARVQVIGSSGKRLLDQTVQRGNMYVIPQSFVTSLKAGENGFEAVSFRTSSSPSISPLTGQGSVFAGLPVQVIANSFQISEEEAERVKEGRKYESVLFSPANSRDVA